MGGKLAAQDSFWGKIFFWISSQEKEEVRTGQVFWNVLDYTRQSRQIFCCIFFNSMHLDILHTLKPKQNINCYFTKYL